MTGRPSRREYRQSVPRPPGAEEVAPEAAFARLPARERSLLARLEVVERAFDSPTRAAPSAAAAVLLALAPRGEETEIVLIRRGLHLRSNAGDVAFPGGRLEEGERPLDAALREAEEEVGLDRGRVRLLGALPTAMRASRPEPIAVFVGAIDSAGGLEPDPGEVDEVLVTPLATLLEPDRYWEEEWVRFGGERWRMSFFDLGDDVVWGASARILVSLFDLVAAHR